MAEITAANVGKLREMTGVGMMECKKALVEAQGNLEVAVDLLRPPPCGAGSGELRHRRLVDRPQLAHRLIPVARDRQARHPLDPPGADTGNRLQGC